MTMPTANQAAFTRLEAEYIRTEEWTDIDIFTLVGNFCDADPNIARALAFHSRDVLHEAGDVELNYTDVVVEVYRRTFFDPAEAAKYGTERFTDNTHGHLDVFVDHMITSKAKQAEGSIFVHNASTARN